MIPAELLAAIVAAPDDPAPRAVAADYLQERGDPHGELIALAIADPVAHASRIAKLESALYTRDCGWRWGFVEQLEISDEVTQLATALGTAPLALLRVLAIRLWSGHPDAVFPVLPGELRALALWSTGPSYPGTFMLRCERTPHLARLEALVGNFLTPLVFPELEELVLRGCTLSVFAAAELPALRELHLHVSTPPTTAELDAILARLPAVRRLAIHASGLRSMIPPVAALEVFELVDNGSGDPGGRRFVVDRRATTPHAAVLCLRGPRGRLIHLDPRRANALDGATIEWTGVDWWLRDTRAYLNRDWRSRVPLRDGDEMISDTVGYRFLAASTEAALLAGATTIRSRYGLRDI